MGNPVADEVPKTPSPFDVRTVKSLVALMSQHDLAEIDLRDGNVRIRLRRGSLPSLANAVAVSPPSAATPGPAPASKHETSSPPAASKSLVEIKAPTPGTFYAASSPDAQPFVRVGDRVSPSTVVCLVEAMKLFNEITADCTGVITEILVQNQQPVEYGQVLFRVDPTG
jgi:acetyl-CoA carboxylase biotin carboxyl carrier protein